MNVRYGKIGKLCSDDGLINIMDVNECKKAVDTMGRSMASSPLSNVPTFPKGCFIDIKERKVFFNGHETGKRHNGSKPICLQSNGK